MALDVLGHEFTHGMNDFMAQLGRTGVYQSRSLNESFADIFGEMVERHATGYSNLSVGSQVPEQHFLGMYHLDLASQIMETKFRLHIW